MISHFNKEHVPRFVEPDFIRFVQFRLQSRSTIAGVAALSRSRRSGDCSVPGDPPDAVILHVTNVERAIRAAGNAIGIVQLRPGRHSSFARITCHACPGESGDERSGGAALSNADDANGEKNFSGQISDRALACLHGSS